MRDSAISNQADTPLRLCYSYSHKDEEFREDLETHLSLLQRQGIIAGWYDRMISAGDEWKSNLDQHFENADIVLLLVSANFLASEYCYEIEMRRAVERHNEGAATVIPVILKPVDNWHSTPFGKLQVCPRNGKPVTKWRSRDEAFADVAMHIRHAVQTRKKPTGVLDSVTVVSHKPTVDAAQSKALIASQRRCCMCWFWSEDASIKDDGRVTSIRTGEGSAEIGFVYLCDRHAKQFVSNAITLAEVTHARDALYKRMDSSLPTNATTLTFRINRNFDEFSEAEAR